MANLGRIVLFSGLLGSALWAATATVGGAGNLISLLLDDSGGGGTGYTTLQFPAAGSDHLVDGYFSIVESGFNPPFVVDGHRVPVDWSPQSAITVPPAPPGGPQRSTATWFDPGFTSWRVEQMTVSYSAAPDDRYVMLVYRLNNTWTGGTIPGAFPTVWFDFDANATAADKWAYDATRALAYHYDDGQNYVGVALLSGTPHSVRARQAAAGSPLPASDTAGADSELNLVTPAVIDPAVNVAANIATGMSIGPFNVQTGTYVLFPVAIVAGANLAEIQAAATSARQKYLTLDFNILVTDDDDDDDEEQGVCAVRPGVPGAGVLVLALFLVMSRRIQARSLTSASASAGPSPAR